MKPLFDSHPRLLIGVVHLRPLPGAPRWKENLGHVINHAVVDATALERGGARALVVENFGDAPFTRGSVGPETVAAMAAVACELRRRIRLPIGFNVLRNDPLAALALCAACDGSFIRVNVHTGAMVTDQGVIEGNACETVRQRARLCPDALILADVHVKHAAPLGATPIEISALDTIERGLADAIILSGTGTGAAADLSELQRVRQALPRARILIGSGITTDNVAEYLQHADGVIVGTSLKGGGRVDNPVDSKRVKALAKAVARIS